MLVYIAGPISGKVDRNIKAFQNAALSVQNAGHTPVIPQSIGPYQHDEDPCPNGYNFDYGHSSACWIRGDLLFMLGSCQAVYMLGDWELSQGASLEHRVAVMCGLGVYYELGRIPLPPVDTKRKEEK